MKDPHYSREQRRYAHPIASREAIVIFMRNLGEPVAFKRLAKELGIEKSRDRDALKLRLKAMVRDGQLIVDRRNVFAIPERVELFAGTISAHQDGFGFLICDDEREDIFLSHRQMRAVFHGDRALVRVRSRDRRGRDEGEIVEVLQRRTTELVGRIYFENRVALLESLNRRIDHEILVEPTDLELSDGQIVVGEVVEPPSLHGLATVQVVSVLGDHLTPTMEVEIALRNHDVPHEFPDDVLEQVDQLPIEVKSQHKRGREDLRHLDFVTIDGADARDFDDAVLCETRGRGGFRLFVAIADVAHYVKPGSSLDQEAYKRGTSVYFPQYVVPMLPEKLSNGLCSLNPEVDRLVMVCEMTISAQGRISSYQFYEGVIHSKGRLTYTQVAEWLNQDAFPKHTENLAALYELTNVLLKARSSRGALEFESKEVGFNLDDEGRIKEMRPIQRNFAHQMIEEAMLCANVSAARLIEKSELPGLYRVHEKPEEEKVEFLREFLKTFNVVLASGDAADYQSALNQLARLQNSHVLQLAVLRSMQQAVYQPENKGHFGLGYSHYTHFTSPIRRYPDLLTHRVIKTLIHSNQPPKEVRRVGPPVKSRRISLESEEAVTHGEHLSFAERRADDAVYEVLEWIKCDFLSEHVGDDFPGVISAVTKFGFFVSLDELFVEGLIHISTLADDYYRFEAGEQCLIGDHSNRAFGLGDVVTVQVARVDVDERKIDLELLTHSPIKRRRIKRPKVSKKRGNRGPKFRRGRRR